MQVTSNGSDQSAQADLRFCWLHLPHCWKSHVAAHLLATIFPKEKGNKEVYNKTLTEHELVIHGESNTTE